MASRGTCWSVTINNPTSSDEEAIATVRQRSGWEIEGQLEQGENETPHYQLIVRTPQVRFSAMKKLFPRSHIELARNPAALSVYVKKEDTRIGELPTGELYPSPQRIWDMFAEWIGNYTKGAYLNFVDEAFLEAFDKFISIHIEQGYVLEFFAINPQNRSIVKRYSASIISRSISRRQKTDRQTENFSEVSINGTEDQTIEDEEEGSEATSCSSGSWTTESG